MRSSSVGMNLTWHESSSTAVSSWGLFAKNASRPKASPASATLRMTTLPRRDEIEILALPLHRMKMPAGTCSSAYKTEPASYILSALICCRRCNAFPERLQRENAPLPFLHRHTQQFSSISTPLDDFIGP